MGRKRTKLIQVITPGNPEERHEQAERLEQVRQPVQEFKTLPEQVAKSRICFKNWYVPELREKYKNYDRIKRIDLVFPYARLDSVGEKKEMLLVDLPKNENEVEQCELKLKLLKKLNYRYIYLEDDSTLYDALMQLGE